MAVWRGAARVETETGGLLGATRWWALASLNTSPSGDVNTWEFTAGTTVSFYFRTGTTGITPPNAADSVRLELRDSAGTVLATLHNGAPPADGTSFTYTLNNAGPIELYVQAEYDGTLGDYNVDSQNTATVGAVSQWARGLVRSNGRVTDITASAYPAGSMFAYGPAGDEFVTLTVQHDPPFTSTDGDIEIAVLKGTGYQQAPVKQDYTSSSTDQAFVIDNERFDDELATYGAKAEPDGDAFLTPDSGAVLWTEFKADGPNVEQDLFHRVNRLDFYDVDPRVTLGTPTLGQTLYNLGEATTIDVSVDNSRSESLTRSLSFQIKDSTGTVKASPTDTGPNYDIDYTLGASDDAAFDFTGKQWTFNLNQSDIDTNPSANAYLVSSKLMLGSAAGLNDLAVQTDQELYNWGDEPQIDYYLSYARGDAYASQTVTTRVLNAADDVQEDSQSIATDGTGLDSYSYTTTNSHAASSDAVGLPKYIDAAHSGNNTDDSANEFYLSSRRLLDLHTQLSGTLSKDDFPDEDANEDSAFVILGDIAYTWAHVENIRNDGTEVQTTGSALTLTIKDPDGGTQDTFSLDTNADGWSDRINIQPTAPAGDWTHELDLVDQFGNTASASHTITYVTPLTSNLHTILQGPVLAKPGQVIRCYYRTEVDDIAEAPQSLPVYRVLDLDNETELVAETSMFNAVDDTQTLNGAHYYFDITMPTTPGRYAVWSRSQLNGNGIRHSQAFRVAGDSFDPTGLFAGPA